MIKEENKVFLLKYFNINTDNYKENELNQILDLITEQLQGEIQKKKDKIKDLELELMNSE